MLVEFMFTDESLNTPLDYMCDNDKVLWHHYINVCQ